jgi:isoamylase
VTFSRVSATESPLIRRRFGAFRPYACACRNIGDDSFDGAPEEARRGKVTHEGRPILADIEIWPGQPYPLGASYDGAGVNFALFSEVAQKVELCLFDDQDQETRVELPESTGFVWHGYVPGLSPGQRYGYRVHGPWDPNAGQRSQPSKLLLDPYARAVEGEVRWNEALFSYRFKRPAASRNDADSAPFAQKAVVVNPLFDWGNDRPLRRPLHETVIYETHVKGLTVLHPEVPEKLRGTYAGLAHPATLRYLTGLGVTAVELLPVHQFIQDSSLSDKGLRNYWGYNSIGFFAPHNDYSSSGERGEQVVEFKQMVQALHAAGLEVILDVVYNHTAEGNHLGPTLSFRGIDNPAYYRLVDDDPRFYMDYTGTGNSVNVRHPHVLQLIMDSLRYWIQEMHVDGFRFDLAVTLSRDSHAADRMSAFFDLIQQDPVVSQTKLIAEPWDTGEGGYQVGNFPPLWSEWNGKYRDTVRDYWRGEPGTLAEFGNRLTGSSDLYENSARRPHASINFLTAHDGFTLADLVSFNERRNEANGEDNNDGEKDNRSWNHGVEGPTDDEGVNALRARQRRNFMATLLLSQGVPMILGGDEIGRTQRGNNNAYAQDNEISWFDWATADAQMLEFTRGLIALRRSHPVFRRRRWFLGRPIHGDEVTDIAWFQPNGDPMGEQAWNEPWSKALGVLLTGDNLGVDERGHPITDSTFYLMFNSSEVDVPFSLPSASWNQSWRLVLDTNTGEPPKVAPEEPASALLPSTDPAGANDVSPEIDTRGLLAPDSEIVVTARSLVVLERFA